jgi:hypothetical protein
MAPLIFLSYVFLFGRFQAEKCRAEKYRPIRLGYDFSARHLSAFLVLKPTPAFLNRINFPSRVNLANRACAKAPVVRANVQAATERFHARAATKAVRGETERFRERAATKAVRGCATADSRARVEDQGDGTRAAAPIRAAVRGAPAAGEEADHSVAALLRGTFRCAKAIRPAKGVRPRGSVLTENRSLRAKACYVHYRVRATCDSRPLSARSEPSSVRPVCIPARETGVQRVRPARPNCEMALLRSDRCCGQALRGLPDHHAWAVIRRFHQVSEPDWLGQPAVGASRRAPRSCARCRRE